MKHFGKAKVNYNTGGEPYFITFIWLKIDICANLSPFLEYKHITMNK